MVQHARFAREDADGFDPPEFRQGFDGLDDDLLDDFPPQRRKKDPRRQPAARAQRHKMPPQDDLSDVQPR